MGRGHTNPQSHRRSYDEFIKENIIVQFGVPHRIISKNGTPFVKNGTPFEEDVGILLGEASLVIALLPPGEGVGESNKQNPHHDHQQDEPRV